MPWSAIAIKPATETRPIARFGTHHTILAGLAISAVLLYTYTVMRYGDTFMTADSHLYYAHAHSWYFDGDANYGNNLAHARHFPAKRSYIAQQPANAHVIIIHPCAWSVISLPFVALADVSIILENFVVDSNLPRDGYSSRFMAFVPLAHVLLGIAGLLAAYAVTARYFDKTISAAATAIVWIGTNIGYFISVEPTMAHAASMAFVSMMIWSVDTIRRSRFTFRGAVLLGLTSGMMIAVRYYNIIWIIIPATLLGPSLVSQCFHRRQGTARNIACFVVSVLAAVLCFVPQIVVNVIVEGAVVGSVTRYGPTLWAPQLWIELLAPQTGLFTLFPLAAVCLSGLFLALRREPRFGLPAALLIGFACIVYLQSCVYAPGYSRRYVGSAPVFVFGLAALLTWANRARWRRMGIVAVIAVLCLKNVALLTMIDRGMVSRRLINQGYAELGSLAHFSPLMPRNAQHLPCCRSGGAPPKLRKDSRTRRTTGAGATFLASAATVHRPLANRTVSSQHYRGGRCSVFVSSRNGNQE